MPLFQVYWLDIRDMRMVRLKSALVCAAFLGCACSTSHDIEIAKQGVAVFHSDFNARNFNSIRERASQEFRNTLTVEQSLAMLSNVKERLGAAGDWSAVGSSVTHTPAGTFVRMQCKTQFAHGDADESFTWRIRAGTARLVGYNISSMTLLAN